MLKKLLYTLLLHKSLSEKIDIANCNELWGMSNSMNKQTVYSMKIYSCIIEPTLEYNKKLSPINNTNYTTIPNNTNYTTISNNTNYTTNTNNTNIPNNTETPSSSQIGMVYFRGNSPSSNKNINQDDIIDLDYSYPSPSSHLNINSTNIEIGLIIGIIASSCIVISLTIFGIIFFRKKHLLNNVTPSNSLKERIIIANPPHSNTSHISSKTNEIVHINQRPSHLNTSHISSKTDETAHISPHPPLPTHISINELKDLPKLPSFNNTTLNIQDSKIENTGENLHDNIKLTDENLHNNIKLLDV